MALGLCSLVRNLRPREHRPAVLDCLDKMCIRDRECSERLGARREVASFVLPLGATINMDGTAIYQGVCAIFIATAFGIDLSLGQMVTIVLTATLASIGTAGVPGAGMVMLAMVLQSVNIPIEGIALVAGIDRIFDMGRTTVNITGDAACAVIVSKMEDRKTAKTQGVVR